MITLTPSGDILLEGLGKVGEWEQSPNGIYCYKVQYDSYTLESSTNDPDSISKRIESRITNGFTPKKWEE